MCVCVCVCVGVIYNVCVYGGLCVCVCVCMMGMYNDCSQPKSVHNDQRSEHNLQPDTVDPGSLPADMDT